MMKDEGGGQTLDYEPPAELRPEPALREAPPRMAATVFFFGIMAVAAAGMFALIRAVIGVL